MNIETWRFFKNLDQLYIDDLLNGMQQKLRVMLREDKDPTLNWPKSQHEHLSRNVPRGTIQNLYMLSSVSVILVIHFIYQKAVITIQWKWTLMPSKNVKTKLPPIRYKDLSTNMQPVMFSRYKSQLS